MPRAAVRTLPAPEILLAGPFAGMRDAPELTAATPELALYLGNMCLTPGPEGSGVTGRPGFGTMGGDALGSAGVRTCQVIRTWTRATGARETTAIVGGKLYSYNWGTGTWTESVTGTHFSSKAITLSTSSRVALVPFADGVVISDGVNTPFWWDGSAGAGGLVKLTNCPVLYGPPTVYYSRLVGIKATDRATMVWSEPGQPNVGYEAGGYNNAWDNPGSYADPLVVLVGTNEALYVFRERVAVAVTGAVTTDWATAGTRANLSEDVGTLSPWAAAAVSQGVLVVDADAQPWLFRYGQPEPMGLWANCRQTVRGTPRASLGNVQTVADDCTNSLLIGYPEVGQTDPSIWLCFNQDDLRFVGVWSWGGASQRAGEVIDDQGIARWAHAGVSDGRLYVHGDLENGPWNDTLAAGTAYVAHACVSAALGYDLDRELLLDQLEAAITGVNVTAVSVSYETPRGQGSTLNATYGGGAGMVWDVDDWDDGDWASITRDATLRVGVRGRGRWVRVILRHAEDNEQFGLTVVRVRAFAAQGNPKRP